MDTPEYGIRKKTGLPSVEKLTPADFWDAKAVTLREAVTGNAPAEKSVVRLLWDDASLYACFEMEAANPEARLTEHDANLYDESVAELFMDPLGLGRVYYELQVNPLNASFDALILNDTQDNRRGPRFQGFRDWNPTSFRHTSKWDQGKKEWIVILALDFADLFFSKNIPPKPGDTWRANILRINGFAPKQTLNAWSPPLVPDFHNVKAFGIWRFYVE
ncbi:MAG: carbohydrate-binding family 9-like protein [Fibrobacterota bacterium]